MFTCHYWFIGRGNNQWTSPLGSALFTIYFNIHLQCLLGQRLSLLQLLASVAVLQAIERTSEYKVQLLFTK